MFQKFLLLSLSIILLKANCSAQKEKVKTKIKSEIRNPKSEIIVGAEKMNEYLPFLKGKNVAVFANQTSMVGHTHLVDTLQKLGINIKVIFGPEHGFRGVADAGEKVGNYIDEKTKIPVVSLYGSKRRPSAEDVKDVDVFIFDIQDVGTRFYTFISSMQEYMEAAIIYNIPMILLDRPNPNGFYVDGPVLDLKFKSFVGMQPVPIVYGMTLGEYAQMLLGEGWLSAEANAAYQKLKSERYMAGAKYFQLKVITCSNYTHKSKYILPVRPSPNLPEIQAVYLYPSTCLFEGTVLSEGRGTSTPFEVFGHPLLPHNLYSFVPKPNEGAKSSKHYYQTCYGWNLHGTPAQVLKEVDNHVQLKWLMEAYKLFPGKDSFFLKGFNRLAGNDVLMQQIKDGKSEEEIRASWEPALSNFKKIRKKYLLYE